MTDIVEWLRDAYNLEGLYEKHKHAADLIEALLALYEQVEPHPDGVEPEIENIKALLPSAKTATDPCPLCGQ